MYSLSLSMSSLLYILPSDLSLPSLPPPPHHITASTSTSWWLLDSQPISLWPRISAVTNHMVARTPSRVREQSVVALNQSGMRILKSTGERTVSERAKYPLSWGSEELQKGAIIECTIFQNICCSSWRSIIFLALLPCRATCIGWNEWKESLLKRSSRG